ncbi:MAG: hypothetical protein ACKO3F_00195 [Cyanobium sp.]
MAFDPRSLERLRELGRSLPQPLPKPEPKAQPSTRAKAAEPRHKVETETDPEQLFRELMQASADGTVPPHLLERLRQVESQRRQRPTAASASGSASGSPADPQPKTPSTRRRDTAIGRPNPKVAADHGDLYTAFQQLLLEDEEP